MPAELVASEDASVLILPDVERGRTGTFETGWRSEGWGVLESWGFIFDARGAADFTCEREVGN